MKRLLFSLIAILPLFNCSHPKYESKKSEAYQVADLIAEAHGLSEFEKIEKIVFNWNVARANGEPFSRKWIWNPKVDSVTAVRSDGNFKYHWKRLDSVSNEVNKGFINDKYWLLAPFQLVWDQHNFTATYTENVNSPGEGKALNKLTIVYGNEGGYTPGDAYDFYIDKDHTVREWVFRRSNREKANIISICKNYTNLGGLLIAQLHERPYTSKVLYFTELSIE